MRQPRVRDRGLGMPHGKIRFTSAILPPYLRRTRSLEELLPWLYLKGITTGDFSEALAALLGPDAPGLSATTITRLKAAWQAEHEAWQARAWRASATSTSGPTASTSTSAWSRSASASWS